MTLYLKSEMSARERAALLTGAVIAMTTAGALIVSAGLPGRVVYTGERIPTAPEIGALAPPFTLPLLDGEEIDLADLHGRPVIVNFWATWCAPCRVEMPELQALYEAQRQNGLRILAVNTGETRETVGDWAGTLDLTFDIALDEQELVAAQYHLRGQPTTYVLSPDGIIIDIIYGATTRSHLETILAPYLADD